MAPRNTNSPSRFFLIIKVLIVASIIAAAGWGWQLLKDPVRFPINTVKVKASYAHTQQETLAKALAPYANQGFFNLDKKGLTQAIKETSPWIADVKLYRTWPDHLYVEIIEQIPVAQWQNKALINAKGEIFYAPIETFPPQLPILITEETQVPTLLETYQKIRVILNPVGVTATEIMMSDRQSITLMLNNGTKIILGGKDSLPRLQRFVKVYPKIFTPDKYAKKVDLRYTHGLAVEWENTQTPEIADVEVVREPPND